jgi:hypothetical protein
MRLNSKPSIKAMAWLCTEIFIRNANTVKLSLNCLNLTGFYKPDYILKSIPKPVRFLYHFKLNITLHYFEIIFWLSIN